MKRMRRWFWSLMVLSMAVAVGQQALANVVITFSDEAAWDGGGMGQYNDKTYEEDGWIFASDEAVRETTEARRIGTYSWRIRSNSWVAANSEAGTYTGFEVRVRPWGTSEPNTANPFTLDYSVNGGSSWTTVSTNIVGNDPLDWIIFNQSFAATAFAANAFQVRVSPTPGAGQRLNVGQFTAFTPNPSLTPEPISRTGFSYLSGSGPSAVQSYVLSGMNLEGSGNILASASAGFEVSLSSGSGFGSSVNVPFAGGVITAQPVTIYVRMAAGLSAGAQAGTIGHTGGGVTESVNVAVSGEVIPAPPAGTLAYYTFTSGSIAPDFVANGITAANFAISAGTLSSTGTSNADDWAALGATVPYAQGSTGYDAENQAEAKHFLIELEAQSGNAISISNISFLQRRTGAGPEMVGISINGTSVYAGPLEDATVVLVDQAISGFNNLSGPMEIRIEGWAGGAGQHRVDNVIIQGTVSGAEPAGPEVADIRRVGGAIQVEIETEADKNFFLQYVDDLMENPQDWNTVGSLMGDGMPQALEDLSELQPMRFYRVLILDRD